MVITDLDSALKSWRAEFQSCYDLIQEWNYRDPRFDIKDMLQDLAHWRAFANSVRAKIASHPDKRAQNFKTQEIDKFIECLEDAHKNYSRIATMIMGELKMNGF